MALGEHDLHDETGAMGLDRRAADRVDDGICVVITTRKPAL